MTYAAVPAVNPRVEMWFSGPEKQRRWTVLIRFILAIPQAIVLFLLEIALLVVVIIGWFGALFIGRLPTWVHQFNSGYVRWYTRFLAYISLLTDEYPPFEFDDLSYQVRPIMPPPGNLNRVAVFFRIILVFPAAIFQTIVLYGLFFPLLFVAWLIMVFSGRMPSALYWAYASLVRYTTRVLAYFYLVTPEYPWGMLGDRQGSAFFAPPTGPPLAGPGRPTAYVPAAPFSQPPPPASTADPETIDPGTEALLDAPAPVPPFAEPAWAPPPPPTWSAATPPSSPWDPASPPPPPPGIEPERSRLLLPRTSRNWIVFAIVWGSILLVVQISLQAVVAGTNLNASIQNYNTIVNDYNASKTKIEAAIVDSQRCTTVTCLRPSHVAAATSLDKFDSDLTAMNLSCTATAPAQTVESDLTQLASAFTDLANSPNAQAYRSTVQTSNLNTLLRSLPTDTNTLLMAVQSSSLAAFCAG